MMPKPPFLAIGIKPHSAQPLPCNREWSIVCGECLVPVIQAMRCCLEREGLLQEQQAQIETWSEPQIMRYEVAVALTRSIGRGWILSLW